MRKRKKEKSLEVMRKTDRDLKKTQRGLTRDQARLEKEEKRLEMEIKKAAKLNNKKLATSYAKQLVSVRKQKERLMGANATVSSVGTQAKKILVTKDFSSWSSVTDTLDDLLAESGDEEEEEAIMNQVLDEIGVEISGKLAEAPSAHRGALPNSRSKVANPKDDELEAQLANLMRN
ncbi:Charged multivesicular body protein 2b [Holothuria leucospilota]|uniref:Charged multivesicular body protein 2b n=1 Tax=Holothuria leucospilota TaxID=206669 RepID=A0A9Q0YR50_HOLLE|nr:Charged multivesicular body protein 2b [Holothuria leucospilota]